MANQQIINDWLNSEEELDLIEKTSLFEAILTYFEHLKSDEKVFELFVNFFVVN